MANLSDADRKAIWSEFMEWKSGQGGGMMPLKPDLRAVFNTADQWVEDNFVSFNNAIPEPARTMLVKKDKVRILKLVIDRRWEVE